MSKDEKDILNKIDQEIGKRIKKYRKQKDLTQEQVAETAGISVKHLSRLENGHHNPHFDMIIQIANALNIPTDALAKDLSEDNLEVFWEGIKPTIEKLSINQLEYLKKSTELLLDYEF